MFCAKIIIVLIVAVNIGQCFCDSRKIMKQLDDGSNSNNERPKENPTFRQLGKYKSCGYGKECVPFLCENPSNNTDYPNIDIRLGNGKCKSYEVCCDIPNQLGCGFRNPNGVDFRNTDQFEFGDFPWMLFIVFQLSTKENHYDLFDGALIAPNAVITTARKVFDGKAEQLIVRAGKLDKQSKDGLPVQERYVREIIVHEDYNDALYDPRNDVAILITDGNFDWAANVRPICLPPSNINFDHSRCFAIGWEMGVYNGQHTFVWKKIDLPVIPRSTCKTNLRNIYGEIFNLHDSFICAGGERDQARYVGYDGSPFVCPVPGTKDRFYLAGISSRAYGCGNTVSLFSSVPHLRPWIDNVLKLRGIDFHHFTIQEAL